tara:strand:- start:970 stop:1242 length:273 start_codon:yes stop_codon:yes gene_type:complete
MTKTQSCECIACRVKSAPVPEFRRSIVRLQRVHDVYEHASALEKVNQQMALTNWVSDMRGRLEAVNFNPNAAVFVPDIPKNTLRIRPRRD